MIAAGGGSPTPPGPVIEPVFYDKLVFDGVAHIDTDYVLPEMCSVRVNLGGETNKAAQRVFRASTNGLIQMHYDSNTTSDTRSVTVYYDSTTVSGRQTRGFSQSLYFWMTPSYFGWGNTAHPLTRGSSHPTGVLQIGGWNSGNPYSGWMSTFRVWGSNAQNATSAYDLDNYSSVASFRPCTYNGEAGLWYVEGNKFFGNTAGAGTLTVANNE